MFIYIGNILYPMQIKYYLFDLDDTLIDIRIYKKICPLIIRELHKKGFDNGYINKIIKKYKLKLNKFGNPDSYELCKALGKINLYYKILNKNINTKYLNKNIIKVFKKLKKNKKKIAIISNSRKRTIRLYVKKYKLGKYISLIFSRDDANVKKDKILFWKRLIKLKRLNPKNCITIGDNYKQDIVLPKKLGFYTFYIKNKNLITKLEKTL